MKLIKKQLSNLISGISPKLFFQIAYFHNRKHLPDLENPKDLSEIWINYLLNGKPKELFYLADKFKVREFVKERIGEEHLVPLVGVWEDPAKMDFEKLPNRFALKMNYGAGMNIVCSDKSCFNKELAFDKLKEWINRPHCYSHSEAHYNLIERKIVCEAYIEDSKGHFPTDYKFMCIHGEPVCVLACFGRESGHASYMPYSLDWRPLPEYNKDGVLYEVQKPVSLDRMIEMAKKLAKGIELVRVDLYDTGKEVIFGEMTLTPAGCIFHRWSQKALNEMGAIYNGKKI